MKRFLGLTPVGWANFVVFQWFFVRLAYCLSKDGTVRDYKFIKWIYPMTGWDFSPWKEFKYVRKQK